MGINHRRLNIVVPQEFLYRPDVVAALQKTEMERVSKSTEVPRRNAETAMPKLYVDRH
jgi:hypothetical protein